MLTITIIAVFVSGFLFSELIRAVITKMEAPICPTMAHESDQFVKERLTNV